ncbi:hypothetical protein J1605_014890 [Eschrichtius robustus]|uniref:Uncharacterized protein n=1 Tax=Eschrichtius robustus TaxID=9764 RepID=A0AB34GB35_ESCRO|nr:hypothetical protein J1605_014890 [Eschrichtius robustus]
MAEASPQPGRYFCHCCSVEIVPRLPGTGPAPNAVGAAGASWEGVAALSGPTAARACVLLPPGGGGLHPGGPCALARVEAAGGLLVKGSVSRPVSPEVPSRKGLVAGQPPAWRSCTQPLATVVSHRQALALRLTPEWPVQSHREAWGRAVCVASCSGLPSRGQPGARVLAQKDPDLFRLSLV